MKQLPSSREAEINILSSILVKPEKLLEIINRINIDDFYYDAHKKIYEAMLTLFTDNKPIEILSLVQAIGKDNIMQVGGISYLTSLLEAGLINTDIIYSTKVLKDKSQRRKLIKLATSVKEKAFNDEFDIYSLMLDVQGEFLNTSCKSKILTDEQLLRKTIEEIESRFKQGGDIPGMKTGFNNFDRATNGLKKGELTIIAGRPSMGKTLIALHMADGLVVNGCKVGLFEMEMTEESLGMRRLTYTALVEGSKIQSGRLTDKEWDRVSMAYSKLASKNGLYTDCSAYASILDIKAKAKLLKQQYGLDVIIIDHLGLLNIDSKERVDVAIGAITRQCKLMAKELDINVILLSQLSRANEKRIDKRPMLSDLRDSGSIEQDADLVVFAYRDEYYNKDSEDKNILELIISKQRNGKTGTLKFNYYDVYQKISEIDYRRR